MSGHDLLDRQPPSRRAVLHTGSALFTLALAGCTERTTSATDSPIGTATPTSTPTGPSYPSQQVTKLIPNDGDSGDFFGTSVATSDDGTTAIIGSHYDDVPTEADDQDDLPPGSAYVFAQTEGKWRQQAKLTADDIHRSQFFGVSVGLSGDGTTAIIGGYSTDQNMGGSGAVWVFARTDGEWSQQAKLIPNDAERDEFANLQITVSDDATTVIIGAENDEDPNGENAGSAYVFEQTDGEWHQQAKLAADDGDPDDAFGARVAVSGDGTTAIIGALNDEDPNGVDQATGHGGGSAYVFEKTDRGWRQQAKLAPDDGDEGDQFGIPAVSRDGTTAIIGPRNTEGAGSAWIFRQTDGEWSQRSKVTAGDDDDAGDGALGGLAVSSDASTVMIGDPDGHVAGSAYVFDQTDGAWSQRTRLAPDDGDDDDLFGNAIAMSSDGTTAIIGTVEDDAPNGRQAGSAYVYE